MLGAAYCLAMAEECDASAQAANDADVRQHFLQDAQSWRDAAMLPKSISTLTHLRSMSESELGGRSLGCPATHLWI